MDMRTEDKIILKAIELYNEHGFSNVTSRDIAKELGISHGNLEYHYKNKEAILHAIYAKMKDEVSGYFSEVIPTVDPIEQFDILMKKMDHFQTKYLFFNLDVIEISRQYPKLKSKVEATVQLRKDQTAAFFTRFAELGYIHPEPTPGFYIRLQHKIRVLITFWDAQDAILKNFDKSQNITMSLSIWDLLYPHFTEKGRQEYARLSQKTKAVI
jgi:AcrR family transcriptional regulator